MNLKQRIVLSAAVTVAASSIANAAFTSGNLAVFEAAASANNTTGSVIELTTGTNASPVNTIAIDGSNAAASPIRFSGSATSTGYLSLTADRSLLTFTGAGTFDSAANANTYATRAVGTLNKAGTFAVPTTYTGASGSQTRAATSLDNSAYYIADQGGLFTNGGTTASPVANLRDIKSFGGVVYSNSASATTTVIQVGTLASTTGSTYTGLPGLANNASIQDFYLISSGQNGSAFDELYVDSATSNTVGTIAKYSLVSGSWVANGSVATTAAGANVGVFGLAATATAGGANLYLTTGQGALTANSVISYADTAGYNATINLGAASTLYTAPTGTILKGIELAPSAVPEPTSLAVLGLSAAAILRRRRNA